MILTALQDSNQVRRVRGGAVLIEQTSKRPTPVENATENNALRGVPLKWSMMATIWLDAGTTVRVLVPFLAQRQRLTIVTSGGWRCNWQNRARIYKVHTVILVGGRRYRWFVYDWHG